MSDRPKAFAVHFLTATGAVFAMLAMLAAIEHAWGLMWLWLVVAFAVDGIDGPLARKYAVGTNAPEYDGVLMDLIIDYLTYVFIPAFALFSSGLLPGWSGWIALLVITYTSVLYFSDTRMKTTDYSFAGFPGCWNMAVLVFFAVEPPWILTMALVIVFAVSMFLNLKFVHPFRTKRWRWVTLPVAFLWTGMAGWAAWLDFEPFRTLEIGLIVTSLYLAFAGIAQQLIHGPDG